MPVPPVPLGAPRCVNQRFPSGPAAIPKIPVPGAVNSVMAPEVVHRPTLTPGAPAPPSANQRFPSGPVVISTGPELAVGTVNSVITPAVVHLPILFVLTSVNQRFPSGPDVIPVGCELAVG